MLLSSTLAIRTINILLEMTDNLLSLKFLRCSCITLGKKKKVSIPNCASKCEVTDYVHCVGSILHQRG
jgi:hypothetical protein